MCLSPIPIFNPSKRVRSIGGALRLKVPCGKCFECKEAKRSQYFVRTFAEYQRIEEKVKQRKAVVYFDTLTYNSENLPFWNGIPVFDHTHIQLFLKRLRRSLEYKGFDVKHNLKYFICSEFGEKKHRPHYHILLFLDFWIEPPVLWKVVRESWKYGRTDRKYPTVKDGKFLGGCADRYVDRNGALKYVSGYVVKDDQFMKQFNDKINELIEAGHEFDDKEIRSLQPRFFLSRDFGLSFIDDQQLKYHFDYEYYVKTGKVTIKDDKHINRDFSIPQYYKRKIFFTLKTEKLYGDLIDENGEPVRYKRGPKKGQIKENVRYYWEPNNDYIQYQLDTCKLKVDNLATNYYDAYNNISRNKRTDSNASLRDCITARLAGRTWRDLAIYSAFYREKLCLADTLYSPFDDFLSDFYSSNFITLNHYADKYLDRQSMKEQEQQLQCYIITDRSSPAFKDFDWILLQLENQILEDSKAVANFKIKLRYQRSKYKSKHLTY